MSRLAPSQIAGVVTHECGRYDDNRGTGLQLFDADQLRNVVSDDFFVGSISVLINYKGTLRGFHVEQGVGRAKYVTCVVGTVFDAIVDLRPASSTFGEWAGLELSADNHVGIYVPPGVGHALLGLSDESTVTILTTATSSGPMETGVDPFDEQIGVSWPEVGQFIRSPRDTAFASLKDLRNH